ncbi:MAG: hypothetical protein HEEMFOPI_00111 [Holosporales bacterium]
MIEEDTNHPSENDNERSTQNSDASTPHLKKSKIQDILTTLQKGIFYTLPSILVIVSAPLWKNFIFSEFKQLSDIKISQDNIQKNDVLQIQRYNELIKKIGDIDVLKKDLENSSADLSNQIQALKNKIETFIKEENDSKAIKDSKEIPSSKIDDCDHIKKLIKTLRDRTLVKDELDSLNRLALTDDFKAIIQPLSNVDAEGTPPLDEIIAEFGLIIEKMPQSHEKSSIDTSKKLSEKILSQVKKNVKITIDGKDVNQSQDQILKDVSVLLNQKDLKKAIEKIESLKDDAFSAWLQKAKNRKIIDDVVTFLLNYKGAVTQ